MIREGLEVKMCRSPDGGKEMYILCRSRDRREKEKAMHERFEQRIDEALKKLRASCDNRKWKKEVIDRRVGKELPSRRPLQRQRQRCRRSFGRLLGKRRRMARVGNGKPS